jgi:caa(3)-type oxidase subunit IV
MASISTSTAGETPSAHATHKRTSPVLVFAILTITTIVEIAVSLLALPKELLNPVLMAMSFVKATLVAAYYMHLRYEKWFYTAVFIVPAVFSLFLMVVVLA